VVFTGKSLWRYIYKGWGRFCHPFAFEVRVGSSILFWQNRWHHGGTLGDLFSSLDVLGVDRDALVQIIVDEWMVMLFCLLFIRDAFVDEAILLSFFNKLNEII